jgi:hypothetical protein
LHLFASLVIAHFLFSLGEFYFVENKWLHEIIYILKIVKELIETTTTQNGLAVKANIFDKV